MIFRIWFVLLFFAPFLSAKAQYTIHDVPGILPANIKETLNKRVGILKDKKNVIEAKIQKHNNKCANLVQGTSLENECKKEQEEINNYQESLRKDIKTYNDDLEEAKSNK